MKHSMTRLETTELAVSLFARSLHPELFEVSERYEHVGKAYQAHVQLTSGGHMIEFRVGNHFLTEVLDAKQATLPRIKRLCLYSAEMSRSLKYKLDSGQTAHVCFECEYLPPDVFRRVEQEYWRDAQSATLSQLVGCKDERDTPGLSFIRVEPTERALGVHTFHLFPEEYAILKTQSLYGMVE